MRNNAITFQLSTQYLPKVALRIERLLLTLEEACQESHPVIHHYALNTIFELIKLIEKPELKSRFLKEFMRIEHAIHKATFTLSDSTFARLFIQIHVLSHLAGRFGEKIHADSFLQSMRLTQASHCIDGELHAPQLLFWLENEHAIRQENLFAWFNQLKPLLDAVAVYLLLLRESATFEPIHLVNGFYQCPLPKSSCQLLMLRMDKEAGLVPKIQIGHHGLSLKVCEASSMREVQQVNIPVEIAICHI